MISMTNVCVSRSGKSILHEIDLEIDDGELVAILGPNGAGKSTLLSVLLAQVPHTGKVLIDGKDLGSLTLSERARAIAFVPQRSMLQTPLVVATVIEQGQYAHAKKSIEEVVEKLRLGDYLHRPFTSLSIGERQRVLIARALCSGAKHLLLDEPTAALDIAESLRILRLLRELRDDGKSVAVVLHSIQHAERFADTIALLKQGKLVGSGEVSLVSAKIDDVFGVKRREGESAIFDLRDAHAK